MEEPGPLDSSGESFSEHSYNSEVGGDYVSEEEEEEYPKTLQYARMLSLQASSAMGLQDYEAAAECYSRVLEIMVAHCGEFNQRCVNAYYFYGFALLRNALVGLCPDESTTNGGVSSNVENDESSSDDITSGFTDDETEYDTNDTPDNDEEESDLDLAWKVLDIARLILEERPTDSMDNVNVLCALGEVNCYRDDPKTCLVDFLLAIHILEILDDEPDLEERSRLYFKIGSSLEATGMTTPAILYFEKSLKCCCSMFSVLAKDICRSLSESNENVVDTSTVPHPFLVLINAIETQITSTRDYYIMLENKLKEIREVEQSSSNIREGIDALSANVRKVPENDVSTSSTTSTDVKVRHLGKVGGSVSKVSVDMYSDSIKPSPLKKRKLGESETGN